MSPKEMYYFIGKCLILDEHREVKGEILEAFRQESFSWEQLVRVGSNHLVLPALYLKFRNAGLLSEMPVELTDHLRQIYEMNRERNVQISEQIEWVKKLFLESHIHPVFLKGAGVLLDGLYKDPGERIMNDIDCLVRMQDLEKAVSLLKGEGYSNPEFSPAKLPMMHHYPALFRPNTPALLEIHKFPVGRRQLQYVDMGEMIDPIVREGNASGPFTLKGEDQILINFIHCQLKDQGQYYANVPLRNIYEFYNLSLKYDLSKISLRHKRLHTLFNNYKAIAVKLFSPAIDLDYKNNLNAKRYISRLERNKTSRFWYRFGSVTRASADLFVGYLFFGLKALYKKELRNHLWVRLGKRASYIHYFSKLKKLVKRPSA
jgi:hypothetical protein